MYSRIARLLAASGEIDTILLTGYFGCYGLDMPVLREHELEVIAELGGNDGTTVVHSMAESSFAVTRYVTTAYRRSRMSTPR